MSFRGMMPEGMFRYRKHKQISLHGYTPGLEYSFHHRRSTDLPPTGHAAQVNRDEYRALANADEYEPWHTFYSAQEPDYEPPTPWRDGFFAGTPARLPGHFGSFSIGVAPAGHDSIDPLLRGLLGELLASGDSGLHEQTIRTLLDPRLSSPSKVSKFDDSMDQMRAYAWSVFSCQVISALAEGPSNGATDEEIVAAALGEAKAILERAASATPIPEGYFGSFIESNAGSDADAGFAHDPPAAMEQALEDVNAV